MNNTAYRSQPTRYGAAARPSRLAAALAACLLLALLGLAHGASPAQAQDPVTVRLAPAAASGAVGDVFTVQVLVDNVPSTGVQGWQVSIAFDPAVVQLRLGQGASTYFAGNLYTTGGFNAFPFVNVAADTITLGQALLGTPPSYPSGSNLLLATIQWEGAAGGASLLDTQGSQVIKDALTGAVYDPLTELDGEIAVAGRRIYLPLLLRRW
jgi:hypothetical protein